MIARRPSRVVRSWISRSIENVREWGTQHPETLLAAIDEESGEVSRAYLQATYGDGDPERVRQEVDDLAALLIQLLDAIDEHPGAFDPLPIAEQLDDDGDEEGSR